MIAQISGTGHMRQRHCHFLKVRYDTIITLTHLYIRTFFRIKDFQTQYRFIFSELSRSWKLSDSIRPLMERGWAQVCCLAIGQAVWWLYEYSSISASIDIAQCDGVYSRVAVAARCWHGVLFHVIDPLLPLPKFSFSFRKFSASDLYPQ